MKKYVFFLKLNLFFALMFLGISVKAQQATYINHPTTFFANQGFSWFGNVTFGPNAIVHIQDGAKLSFYGETMKVEPGAKFIYINSSGGVVQKGTGAIVFKEGNPLNTGIKKQNLIGNLGNVVIDNINGVRLQGNALISNEVSFIKGKFFLENFNLILAENAQFSNVNEDMYVVTEGTGVIKKSIPSSKSFTFPVGTSVSYNPATITTNTTAQTFSVQVADFTNSLADEKSLASRSIDRTWQIFSDAKTNVELSLQHNVASNQSGFNGVKSIISQQTAKGTWSQSCFVDPLTTSNITFGKNVIIPAGIDDTAYFTKQTSVCKDVDLAIVKSVLLTTSFNNEYFDYKISVTNNGSKIASAVSVLDELPKGLKYEASTQPSDEKIKPSYDLTKGPNGTLSWTLGDVAAQATIDLVFRVIYESAVDLKPGDSITISNTAVVVCAEDANLANNESTALKYINVFQESKNVFTPNGDGKNDYLTFPETGIGKFSNLEIYNKLGNIVFKAIDYKNDWQGVGLKSGTYFYYLRFKDENGVERNRRSWITLIREEN
ncbi:MAG: gliding motility-associated C-terminal domain-containing protein [Sphingobacteriaceae bacterium]|nr:gliding motility-associated C-terminal domain-containing protein [Sphingobacteriaceae bacterium]